MRGKILLLLLLAFGLLSAALVTSGDAGISFAKNKTAEMCSQYGVGPVYVCGGNVVRVDWTNTTKGSTYFYPDSRIVSCLPVEASKQDAACVQLTMPNYCPAAPNCTGLVQPPEEPEQNVTTNETVANETGTNETVIPEQPPEQPPQQPNKTEQGGISIPFVGTIGGGKATAESNPLDNAALIVVVVAILLVVGLYFVFKRTVMH